MFLWDVKTKRKMLLAGNFAKFIANGLTHCALEVYLVAVYLDGTYFSVQSIRDYRGKIYIYDNKKIQSFQCLSVTHSLT